MLGFRSLWFISPTNDIVWVSLVSIVAHYVDYVSFTVVYWIAWLAPFRFQDSVLPCVPKIISLLSGELYRHMRSGHVRGNE